MAEKLDYQAIVKHILDIIPELPDCNFTYEEMERFLKKVGLRFSLVTVRRNGKMWQYLCSLETTYHPTSIYFHKHVATYSTCGTSNFTSVDEVVKQLFQEAMYYKIYVGSYGAFSEIIEWSEKYKEFKRRDLTEKEEINLNCDY